MLAKFLQKVFVLGILCMVVNCLASCNEVSVDVAETAGLTESALLQDITTLKGDVSEDCEESIRVTDSYCTTDHSFSNSTKEFPPSDLSNLTDSESTSDSEHIHAYTSMMVNPTCTDKGYTVNSCSCGDSFRDLYRHALGHAFGAWIVTKDPTEFSEGEQKRFCSRCPEEEATIIDKIAPLGCVGRGIDVYEVQTLALEYINTLEGAVADPALVGVDRGGYAGWTLRIFTSPYNSQEELFARVKEGLLSQYKSCRKVCPNVKLNIWIDYDPVNEEEYCLYILYFAF